jgi:hypothetical protein
MGKNNMPVGSLIISIIILILIIVIFIIFICNCNNQQNNNQQLNPKALVAAAAIKKNKSNFIMGGPSMTIVCPYGITSGGGCLRCPYGTTSGGGCLICPPNSISTMNGGCYPMGVNAGVFVSPNSFSSCPNGSTTFGNCFSPSTSYLLPININPYTVYTTTIYSVN